MAFHCIGCNYPSSSLPGAPAATALQCRHQDKVITQCELMQAALMWILHSSDLVLQGSFILEPESFKANGSYGSSFLSSDISSWYSHCSSSPYHSRASCVKYIQKTFHTAER